MENRVAFVRAMIDAVADIDEFEMRNGSGPLSRTLEQDFEEYEAEE